MINEQKNGLTSGLRNVWYVYKKNEYLIIKYTASKSKFVNHLLGAGIQQNKVVYFFA